MKIYRREAPSYLLFVVVAVIIIFGILFGILPAIDKAKTEKPYSADLEDGDMVYMEITDLVPEYTTNSSTIICTSTTADGQKVWVMMDSFEYEDFEGAATSYLGATPTYSPISFDEPILVHGKIRDADDVGVDGLENAIDSETIVLYKPDKD